MGRGFDGVKQEVENLEKRRASGSAGFIRYLRLQAGESAVVRFLEQGDDVNWCIVGEIPPRGDMKWADWVPVIDQKGDGSVKCPVRERGVRTKFRGIIRLVWRDAPVFETVTVDGRQRTNWGNVVGHTDTQAVWDQGIQVFEDLASKDATYKGLCSRDFRITRHGSGLETKYKIDPADVDAGPVEMTAEDKAMQRDLIDISSLVTPPSYDDLVALLEGRAPSGNSSQSSQEMTPPEQRANPFAKKRD